MSTVVEVSVPTVPTVPTEPKTRREIFLDAAALLEEHGWSTNYLLDSNGKMCILGAVGRSLGLDIVPDGDHGNDFVYAIAADAIGVDSDEVFGWNDEGGEGGEGIGQARATEALRRLANGESWKDITSS